MEHDYSIRLSTARDIDRIMEVYESAKEYMRSKDNFAQWTGGYPDKKRILTDIANCNHYLAEDDEGCLLMVFSFIQGEDPTYRIIEKGNWLSDKPYGTIHRIASNGRRGGMLKACVDYCKELNDNIRIDTHAHNSPMLNALNRLEFKFCGIIYTDDGSPRLAFQKDFRSTITMDIDFVHD